MVSSCQLSLCLSCTSGISFCLGCCQCLSRAAVLEDLLSRVDGAASEQDLGKRSQSFASTLRLAYRAGFTLDLTFRLRDCDGSSRSTGLPAQSCCLLWLFTSSSLDKPFPLLPASQHLLPRELDLGHGKLLKGYRVILQIRDKGRQR